MPSTSTFVIADAVGNFSKHDGSSASSDLKMQGAREGGAVMPLVTVGMVAIIAMAGLALDMGHTYFNRTRLQNALDAAALSAAKSISDGRSVADASADAIAVFNFHLEGELAEANLVPTIEYSDTLIPFTPGAVQPDARFVRARLDSLPVTVWLARVLPGVGDTLAVGGSAVAGPIPLGTGAGETCDVAPLLMCGDPGGASGPDTDCTDGSCYGYSTNEEITLKTHSASSGDWEVGPGNFQLIELECGPGGACVRDNLAGAYDGCLANGEPVTTKPGNTVGPVAQGFNTRFGIYQGGMSSTDYPPDIVTYSAPDFWHGDYQQRLEHGPWDYQPLSDGGTGVENRRVLAVPIGDCTGTTNGRGDVPVLGLGCFFMTRPTSHSGSTQEIYGQLIEECEADGDVPEAPSESGFVPHKIILYKDPDRIDS
jgi:hypothetical protein